MGKLCSNVSPVTSVNGLSVMRNKPCNTSNYNNMGSRTIDYVVFHYTGNSKDTAIANANYFMGANRNASAHYFVDDTSIYQSVDANDKAWHCGTSGSYYHNSCRNSNSIGIEMCCTAGNYKVSAKTLENAAQLGAALCRYLGITDIDKYVLRHYDVTHKKCPAQMAGSDNAEWVAFKKRIKEILAGASASATKDTKIDTVKEVQTWLNKTYKAGLNVDGDYGPKTKEALIKVLQKSLGVNDDGIYGPKTNSAIKNNNLKKGSSGEMVKVLQGLLVCNGYASAYVDGDYGNGTVQAVKSYQSKKGLNANGIANSSTFSALCG